MENKYNFVNSYVTNTGIICVKLFEIDALIRVELTTVKDKFLN